MLDLKSGDPESKSRSDHQLDLFQVSPSFNSSAALGHSELLCPLLVGILNLQSLFVVFC